MDYSQNSGQCLSMAPSQTATIRQPRLQVFSEMFEKELSRLDSTLSAMSVKLQNIHKYSELNKEDSNKESASECALDSLHRQVITLAQYNCRLEYMLRHLNEIV